MSLTVEPETPSGDPPVAESDAKPLTVRSTANPSPAALATHRLCPYLEFEDGAWRSASPDRGHRCGAVTPVALLSLEKQRRLCLTERHTVCPAYVAARGVDSADDGPPLSIAVGPGRPPAPEGVTRWAIVRTTPVILDNSRVPFVGSFAGSRALGQVALALLLVAAFAAIALGRLGGPSSASLVGAGPSPTPAPTSRAARVPSLEPTPAASEQPATPKPKPTRTPKPTRSPARTESPSPPTPATYTVRSGDTLYGIAIEFNTSVRELKRLNHLTTNNLHIGQVLKIPRS